jgi:CheY-like chemotaxis protein
MSSVLVVDDDPNILALLRGWLEEAGFEVRVAGGWTAGIDSIGRAIPDLVVLDMFMPGVTGLDAIRLFRTRAPTVPLIAISGQIFDDQPFPDQIRKLAAELGAAACLRKPFTADTLLREIRRQLSGKGRASGRADAERQDRSSAAAADDD